MQKMWAYLMVYSSVPSSVIRSSLLGMVMLWATDFLPLWKKVSGVQILLAIRLLRRSTAMGPLNFNRSSFQLCLKKTSMVYSYRWTVGGGEQKKSTTNPEPPSWFLCVGPDAAGSGKVLSNPTLFFFFTLIRVLTSPPFSSRVTLTFLRYSWPSFPAGSCLFMLKALVNIGAICWMVFWLAFLKNCLHCQVS